MINLYRDVWIMHLCVLYSIHPCLRCINYNIMQDDENSNVLFFQLQSGTYLPTFRLDALAILRVTLWSIELWTILYSITLLYYNNNDAAWHVNYNMPIFVFGNY